MIKDAPILEPIQPMPPAWAIWFQSLVKGINGVYTVATLPAGVLGDRAFVSDATAPVFGAAAVGSGSTASPVYHDGTVWRVG